MSDNHDDDVSATTAAGLDLNHALELFLDSAEGRELIKSTILSNENGTSLVENLIKDYIKTEEGNEFFKAQIKSFLSSEAKGLFDAEIIRVIQDFFGTEGGKALFTVCANELNGSTQPDDVSDSKLDQDYVPDPEYDSDAELDSEVEEVAAPPPTKKTKIAKPTRLVMDTPQGKKQVNISG